MTNDEDAWFEPKGFGFGFRPANWRGWLATAVYTALMISLVNVTIHASFVRWALMTIVTIGYFALAAHNTRGGLAWRWEDRK